MGGFPRVRGAAWNEQVFTRSKVAQRGGPVRRSIASIEHHSSLASLFAAARDRGWTIVQKGRDWHLYDARITFAKVVGIASGGMPILAP